MAMPTLLDIAINNGCDPIAGILEEVVNNKPEIMGRPARTIKGLSFRTRVRTSLFSGGSFFRDTNEGVTVGKGTYRNETFACHLLNPRWECDKAAAGRFEDGEAAFVGQEAEGMLSAAMNEVCAQFYYGTGNEAKGFPGLIASYDSTNMVVDAGGTTASTGSSVWGVRFGVKDIMWLVGNDGAMSLSPPTEQRATDGSGKPYTIIVQELLSYIGLFFGTKYSAVRIKKLTADSGKGLTDSLLSQALEKFPAGMGPDVWFMSRRSLGQLQRSRTTYSPTGNYAPLPTEYEGIPIIVTDNILNTESLSL